MQALGYPTARPRRPTASATAPSARPTCSATAGGGWRFAGREDTLLKIKGRWVNLNDLEERLVTGHAGPVEGAAVRRRCRRHRRAGLFFVAREGEQAAVEQALRERMETLPHYQRPRWLHTVEAIPHRHRQDAAPQARGIDGASCMSAVQLERRGGTLVATLDRAPVNAIDDELLARRMRMRSVEAERDESIAALHLRSAQCSAPAPISR